MRNTSIDVYRCLSIINNNFLNYIDNVAKTYLNTNVNLEKVLNVSSFK